MAKISPFLSTPGQWVEKLAQLRAQRKSIEEMEDRLKEKLLLHMKEQDLETVPGDEHEARIEKRESSDFSQTALASTFGEAWLIKAKKSLPVRVSESLAIRAKRVEEAAEPIGSSVKSREIVNHFTRKGK